MKSTEVGFSNKDIAKINFENGDTIRLINLDTHEIFEFTIREDSHKYLRNLHTAIKTLHKKHKEGIPEVKEISYPPPVAYRNALAVGVIEVLLKNV